MQRNIKLVLTGALTSLLVSCGASNTILMPKADGSFTLVATAASKFEAQKSATNKAVEICGGERQFVITNTKYAYQGVLPEEANKLSGNGKDTDYQVTLDFNCVAEAK